MAGVTTLDIRMVDNVSPTMRRVDRQAKQLNKTVNGTKNSFNAAGKSSKNVARGFLGIGASANAAKVAVQGLGQAFNVALLGIPALVGGVAAAFGTLSKQDFAEAKVKSLGTDSDVLVKKLKLVSQELQGARSVAELTGAAYDVASAGFVEAGDAAKVLKAASLGATGGFSDLNTVGNAATSVLNAYGKSADEAAFLVDQFIQTQNDGKIIVAEYAAGIGKVASVAAALKVPLSEINAAMATATASGVNAEVAFTGLKAALSRLSGPRAQKHFERLGIEINAATLAQDGMFKTLQKLEGLDMGDLIAIFGQEAIQTMAPVINNMEKYGALIKKQEEAQGAAARAAFLANDTIAGSIKRLGTSITNMFADGTEAGEVLKLLIKATAVTFESLGLAIKTIVAPFRALGNVAAGFFEELGIGTGAMQSLTESWFDFLKALDVGFQKTNELSRKLGRAMAEIAAMMKKPFTDAFSWITQKINEFWNGLPEWMKWAVKKVTGAGQAVSDAISGSVTGATSAIGSFFTETPEMAAARIKQENSLKTQKELVEKLSASAKALNDVYNNIGLSISSGINEAIKGAIQGTKTLGEVAANVFNRISNLLIDFAIQQAMLGLAGGPTTAIGKFLTGTRASGGPVNSGESYLVGEKGPEVFTPSTSGKISTSSSFGSVVVNVDATGSSAEGNEPTAQQLGRLIGAAVQAELVRQKRPGGILA